MQARMVLNPSDYSVDPTDGNYNPTDLDTYKRIAGFIVAATMVLYAFGFAQNRGVPFMNNLLSSVGLGSQGGDVEVFN